MADTLKAITDTASFDVARLKGRTRGAMVGSLFGAFWLFEGAYWGGIGGPARLTAIALCGIAFAAWPATRLRSLRRSKISAADRQRRKALRGPYWAVVTIECLACGGAVIWLTHIRRLDLLPQFFGVIIGFHFLPLARIFKMPIYYASGAVMAAGVSASFVIPAGNARSFAACGVIGLSLWATAAVNLWQDRLSFRQLAEHR